MKRYVLVIWMVAMSVAAMATSQLFIHQNTTPAAGGVVNYTLISGNLYTIEAVPNEGYKFLYWLDDNSTENPVQHEAEMDVTKDKRFCAVFAKISDTELSALTTGSVQVTTNDIDQFTFFLTPQPLSCGVFSQWSDEQTTSPRSYESESGNISPVFINTKNEYKKDESQGGGTIQVTSHVCGYTLEAVPADGYHFVGWKDGEKAAIRDVDELSDVTLYAQFANAPVVIETTSYPTIADAVTAAESTDVITLLIDIDEDVDISKEVIIDGGGHTIGDMTIENGGKVTLNSSLTINNLYLNTTTGSSSQLVNTANLTYNKAYVDVNLKAGYEECDDNLWYAICLPFDVDINTGIKRAGEDATLTNGIDYLIWYYDGDLRAATANGWVVMSGGDMQAGSFYMMGIQGTKSKWRFQKKDSAPLAAAATRQLYAFDGPVTERGWNAVGNPTLVYSNASTANSITIAQVYENGAATPNYKVKNFAESSFVMGSPFFIQTAGADQLNLTPVTNETQHALYAPRYVNSEEGIYYKIQLMKNDEEQDVVFLTAREEASDTYEIGKDVIKLIGGNTNSYIWTNAYGYRLCAQDARLVNNEATYQLSLYAPYEDNYVLNVANSHIADIYLIQNGNAVWNLSNGSYAFRLTKGINTSYSLLICEAQAITTDIPDINAEDSSNNRKFVYKGQLYINFNGRIYDARGELVR